MAAVKGAKTIGATFSNEEVVERVIYDFALDAGATGALDLFTAGADLVLTHFSFTVKTAATSGGSATLAVGITGSTSLFSTVTQGAVANLTLGTVIFPAVVEGAPNVLALPAKLASGAKILQTIGTATLLTGKVEYCVKYIRA